jgi:hypothetical protein
MKKLYFLASLLSVFLPNALYADSPSWTFVEASYIAAEVDALEDAADEIGADISEPEGFEIAGSLAVADFVYLDFLYSDLSNDDDVTFFDGKVNVDLDVERIGAGIGFSWAVADSTDLYVHLGYEEWTIELEASTSGYGETEEVDDNGATAAVGIRTIVAEGLELHGEIGYSDIFEEATFLTGIYYTFADHFTIGGGYEKIDDFESLRATFRYQF